MLKKRICRTSEVGARELEAAEAEADVLVTAGSVEPACAVVGKVWSLRDRVRAMIKKKELGKNV